MASTSKTKKPAAAKGKAAPKGRVPGIFEVIPGETPVDEVVAKIAAMKAEKPAAKDKGKATTRAKAPAKKRKSIASDEGLASPSVASDHFGRPTDYKPEYARIARVMCKNGATDSDLAEAFEVAVSTIWRWQTSRPDFCSALKVEKDEFDSRVERSLAQRAVGYTYDAVKIFMPAGSDKPIYAPYREHVPPDPGACKLWLTNRRRGEWSDTSKHELTGKDGDKLIPENASSREVARAVLDILREAKASDGAAQQG